MGTTILAWLIAILGLLMIAGGVWDVVDLWNQTTQAYSPPLRYYGMAIGMIFGGFGMLGIAQALRLLRLVHTQWAEGVLGLERSSRRRLGAGAGPARGSNGRNPRPGARLTGAFSPRRDVTGCVPASPLNSSRLIARESI